MKYADLIDGHATRSEMQAFLVSGKNGGFGSLCDKGLA